MMGQISTWIGFGSAIISIFLFLYCIVLHIKLNTLRKKYDFFMNGESGTGLERKLSMEVTELRETAKAMDVLFQQQSIIKKIQNDTFQKIGFVKYNAFENIGNDLSFSLTLLDGNNNGLCISSVYGRNESRIFSKPIIEGKSMVSLSQEELMSLNDAIGSNSNKEVLVSSAVSNK